MSKIKMKKGLATILASTLLAVSLLGCGEQITDPIISVEEGDDTISYQFVECTMGDVVLTETVRCTYRKNGEQEIKFPVSGMVVNKVYVQAGDPVKKGQILVELASDSLKQSIDQLEYQIKRNEYLLGYLDEQESIDSQNAWLNYMYVTSQYTTDKTVLNKTLDSIKENNEALRTQYNDNLEFDRLKLAELKKQYSESHIYSDLDGVVFQVTKNLEGSTSNVEDVVMIVVDNSVGYFESSSESVRQHVKEGDKVSLNIVYGNGHGTYEIIPTRMNEWGDSQYFEIYTSDDASGSIEAGTSGNMTIELDARRNVLQLPSTCVHQADNDYYVYVLNDDGMREVKWIEVGLHGDSSYEITDGLKEGDKVIKR